MENNINSIAVYGDSILKGIVTGTSDKRYEVLKENSLALASEKLGFTLYNYSVFGNVISKAQKTLNYNLSKGLSADAVIIESGGNDCDHDWILMSKDPLNPPDHRTPLDDFMRILDEMVHTVREHKMTPILMTMPPIVAERWYKTICNGANPDVIRDYLLGDIQDLYRKHELYSLCITEYAWKNNIQFVDMRKAMLELYDYREEMCLDGIHPNAQGYAYMATVWEKELPRIKREF